MRTGHVARQVIAAGANSGNAAIEEVVQGIDMGWRPRYDDLEVVVRTAWNGEPKLQGCGPALGTRA